MTSCHYNCKKENTKESFLYNLIHLLLEVRKSDLVFWNAFWNVFHTRKIVTLTAKVNGNSLSGLVGNCHPDDRFTFALSKPLLSTASVCDVTSSCVKSIVCRADAAKLIWSLRNYDGDGKKNVKKWAKQQLCTSITLFCTFLCCLCTTTTWNDQILRLLENRNGKAINSTISVSIRARSPLVSSNQNSLLLSNRANWDNRENV